MKKILFLALLLSSPALFAQVPVNIVYPINGGGYPVGSPGGAGAEYVTFSFGTTCPGGGYSVKWGVDNTTYGSTRFYDQASVQQVHKVASGKHVFWVFSSCGEDRVYFYVK